MSISRIAYYRSFPHANTRTDKYIEIDELGENNILYQNTFNIKYIRVYDTLTLLLFASVITGFSLAHNQWGFGSLLGSP